MQQAQHPDSVLRKMRSPMPSRYTDNFPPLIVFSNKPSSKVTDGANLAKVMFFLVFLMFVSLAAVVFLEPFL